MFSTAAFFLGYHGWWPKSQESATYGRRRPLGTGDGMSIWLAMVDVGRDHFNTWFLFVKTKASPPKKMGRWKESARGWDREEGNYKVAPPMFKPCEVWRVACSCLQDSKPCPALPSVATKSSAAWWPSATPANQSQPIQKQCQCHLPNSVWKSCVWKLCERVVCDKEERRGGGGGGGGGGAAGCRAEKQETHTMRWGKTIGKASLGSTSSQARLFPVGMGKRCAAGGLQLSPQIVAATTQGVFCAWLAASVEVGASGTRLDTLLGFLMGVWWVCRFW